MKTVKVGKRVNAVDLYDEIIAAVPELAPTPTGPDGKLEAKFIIEQQDDQTLLVHVPDDLDLDDAHIANTVKAHKRKPEKTVDPVADAMKVVKAKADKGDDLAKAMMTILEQRG
jgi:hypothetical protein